MLEFGLMPSPTVFAAQLSMHDLTEQQPFVGQLRLAFSGPSMGAEVAGFHFH